MDSVMEALLRSLEELVPYTLARVIVPEGGPHLLALGEREIPERPKASPKYHPGHPLTLIADQCPFLKKEGPGRPKECLCSGHKRRKRLAYVHRPQSFAFMAVGTPEGIR
jgi:hypothetical protein